MKRTKPKSGYSHHDKSYWSEVISGQSESGQSVKDYCRAQGVSASSFYRWQKLLGPEPERGNGFNTIRIEGSPSLGVRVDLPGGVCLSFTALPPVEAQLMKDDLRAKGLLPTISPYADGLTCDPLVFNSGGSSGNGKQYEDIVDWVFIELRDATDPSIVVASRSALLRRDGVVVDVDGVSQILILSVDPANDYYVVLKHRSHLGVMTATPISLE